MGGSNNLQFSGISVMHSGRSIPLFASKTSGPTENKIEGTGSNNFSSRSLGMIVNGIAFISLDSGPVNPGYE